MLICEVCDAMPADEYLYYILIYLTSNLATWLVEMYLAFWCSLLHFISIFLFSSIDKVMADSLEERSMSFSHQKARDLTAIMIRKQTNLCVSADVTTADELVNLVRQVGPYVCMVKTHIDIISDFSVELINKLKQLSTEFDLMLFEDRKFADLGSTVQKQFSDGIHCISSWADFINAHVVVGPGIIKGLQSVSQGQSLILIAQMSAAGNLCNSGYTQEAVKMAEDNRSFVSGFICTESVTKDKTFLNFVPGVHISSAGDGLGQQYVSPYDAIKKGADIIIVGRGIYKAVDPAAAAKEYRDAGFKAYCDLIRV